MLPTKKKYRYIIITLTLFFPGKHQLRELREDRHERLGHPLQPHDGRCPLEQQQHCDDLGDI